MERTDPGGGLERTRFSGFSLLKKPFRVNKDTDLFRKPEGKEGRGQVP